MANFLALLRRKPEPTSTPIVHAPPAPGANQERKGNYLGVRTVIAEGTTITGSLSVQENIIVNGRVEGNLSALECLALLKPTSVVTGLVQAGQLYVAGEVHGGLRGRFIRLFPSAKVCGTIEAERLVIDMGASIHNDGMNIGNPIVNTGELHGAADSVTPLRGAGAR